LSEITHDMQMCRNALEVCCECRCGNKELARAYIPMQGFGELFKPEVGLRKGTIFPELFKPYVPCRGHR